jgi:hypothetical protein
MAVGLMMTPSANDGTPVDLAQERNRANIFAAVSRLTASSSRPATQANDGADLLAHPRWPVEQAEVWETLRASFPELAGIRAPRTRLDVGAG